MYIRLLNLELKNFFRNPQFGTNLVFKILSFFGFFWMGLAFVMMGVGLYYLSLEEFGEDPILLFSKYFIFYWVVDLILRYFIQQLPTQNIKPFLTTGLTKRTLVNYTMVKILTHFFNWGNLLFLIPFAVVNIVDGEVSLLRMVLFTVGIYSLFYFNNFLNIILNGKDWVVFAVFAIVCGLGALEYYNIVDLTHYSERVFYSLFESPWLNVIPIILAGLMGYLAYRLIYSNFYLDKGLELKKVEGKTEDIKFLRRFGVMGTFVNNDIRLLKRSKAAKSAAVMGFVFLLYGFLMFMDGYRNDFMRLFCGIFVTGGFMMMFGQRVPAWDSSYYPLMMTQKVPYKKYLMGKWYLLVLGVLVSIVLSTFYLFFGVDIYLTILAAGLYNLGVNSYITLLAGVFNKQAIDLNSSTKSFGGGKNSFNMKILLLMIPQLLVPMVVFAITKYFFGIYGAVASLGLLGVIGFLVREKVFDLIVKAYKTEKYAALEAFKNNKN